MSGLTVSFKLPYAPVENLRALLEREYARIRMEIDAAQSLGEPARRNALAGLARLQWQIEELARHFEVTL